MKKMKKIIGGVAAFALPMLAFAQGPQLSNLEQFVRSIGRLINLLLPIVVALALLAFFWGLAQFIFAAGDEEAKKKGKQTMIWGVVALFIMVSVWGLVGFIGSALGIGQGASSGNIPTVSGLPS
jgi:hypothetical protein